MLVSHTLQGTSSVGDSRSGQFRDLSPEGERDDIHMFPLDEEALEQEAEVAWGTRDFQGWWEKYGIS